MRRRQWTDRLTGALGVIFLLLGVAETVRVVRSGDGGLWFWFGFLVGAGVLVLAGQRLSARRPGLGLGMVVAGCLLGTLPTMWTLVVPLLAVAVVVLWAIRAGEAGYRDA